MKVLFVDDEPGNISDAVDEVKNTVKDAIVCTENNFANVSGRLRDFRPDILVIDLVHQASICQDGGVVGLKSLNSIWDTRFMPMIVYSGLPELLEDEISGHPLVEIVPKGPRSDLQVADAVRKLSDVVKSLNETRNRLETEIAVVLRDVAPTVFVALQETGSSVSEAIERACFRRLAAIVDDPDMVYGQCEPWEQYVFPPLSDDLMLGDVLMRTNGSSDDPNAFRVVLTPSCDLATHGSPNVSDALVARCRPWQDRLGSIGLGGAKRRDLIKRLPSMLNRGFQDSIIPIPSLPGKIPDMVVDLRELCLVPLCDIGHDRGYRRVASVDSPFRELVSWAYIQMSGRPGLPIRDVRGWAKDIANETVG